MTAVDAEQRIDDRVKIVSGGQTGVDRGALDAALACGGEAGAYDYARTVIAHVLAR